MKLTTEHPTDRHNFTLVTVYNNEDYVQLRMWYSYETCIAFQLPNRSVIIRENDWSGTTGKHLNYIDSDKSNRIPSQQFEDKLSEVDINITTPLSTIQAKELSNMSNTLRS